ncbi:hypothetical protein U1Q18_011321 [Sarracenia purpurea var. burkii]
MTEPFPWLVWWVGLSTVGGPPSVVARVVKAQPVVAIRSQRDNWRDVSFVVAFSEDAPRHLAGQLCPVVGGAI